MSKYKSPMKEVNHSIGVLYEVSLQSNLRLTESVNNLRVTIGNLMSSDSRVKDIIRAQQLIANKHKILAKVKCL